MVRVASASILFVVGAGGGARRGVLVGIEVIDGHGGDFGARVWDWLAGEVGERGFEGVGAVGGGDFAAAWWGDFHPAFAVGGEG